jgi:predicted transcriptional regulator
VKPIVPTKPASKRLQPVSVKFSDEVLKRIARVSKATNNSRNATIVHLVTDALERWEAAQAGSPKPSR